MPPLTLDERIFFDYDQLKRLLYVFFMKTRTAEQVIAADDMAFIERLWQDWSPGYDAAADVRMAKQCLREPRHLQAAIGYYRADEPGLHPTGSSDPFAAEHEALLRTRHNRRSICTATATAASTSASSATPSSTSHPARVSRSSRMRATSCTSSGRARSTSASSPG